MTPKNPAIHKINQAMSPLALVLVFVGWLQTASAEKPDYTDKDIDAELAEEARAEKDAEAAAQAALDAKKSAQVSAKLIQRYTSLKEGLHKKLAPRIPDLKDEAKVMQLLQSDKLDDQLVTYSVLHSATPEGLAEFVSQGKEQEKLVEQLLSSPDLMKQMLVADGPTALKRGAPQWGPAMQIYSDIQKASKHAKAGIFQRLAVAVALQHAVPLWQSNCELRPGPEFVPPLERYMGYEKAYLAGELDPSFPTFDAFELGMVVDEHEPEWTHAWGREMLRNFRPDSLFSATGNGSYSRFVSSNIPNTLARKKYDSPKFQGYQNILMNHGICGRRAFFGRFILRCHGIPTVKRPSRRHGALARWSSSGWRIDLGPGWGSGGTNTPYGKDRDFLKSTQARENVEAYLQVKRAQWVGDLMGEERQYAGEAKADTWNGMSLVVQDRIIMALKEGKLKPTEKSALMDADEPTMAEKAIAKQATEEAEAIRYEKDGTIAVPAGAYDSIGGRAPKNAFSMQSFKGGKQVYMRGFGPIAVPILKGGNFKKGSNDNRSAKRIRRSGYGDYGDFGMRLAVTPKGNNPSAELTLDIGKGGKIEFIYVKPGTFMMGSEKTEETKFTGSEAPRHEVEITKGYYLGKYEVTNAQYNGDINTKNPNHPKGGISKEEAEFICKKFSEITGYEVRLPTEAEWEHAARAGTSTPWFFGNDPSKLGDYAWCQENSGGKAHPVGQKKPNPWGFHDIYGNHWECVSDLYHKDYYANSARKDPVGWKQPPEYTLIYTVKAPKSGKYALTADIVSVNFDQIISFKVNDAADVKLVRLPLTLGEWATSPKVVVELKAGENKIEMLRQDPVQYGIAVKSFILKPAN
ncbi:MAG: SUMF1/EgtB/PvdO family nonheme iron enzyme [Luteolibacter sp.]